MSDGHRPPSGEVRADNPSRRQALRAMTGAFAQIGLFSIGLDTAAAYAAPAPSDGFSATSDANATGAIDAGRFLKLSAILTDRDSLNAHASSRMLDAFNDGDPAFSRRAGALFRLAQSQHEAAAPGSDTAQWLLDIATASGLHDTALSIVRAWYTGTVGHGPRQRLIAYAEALMYQPVKDALIVPTYCPNGPLWWVAAVPDVGIAPPKAHPAPPAGTNKPRRAAPAPLHQHG